MCKKLILIYPPIDPQYYIAGSNDSPPLGLVVLQNYLQRYKKINIDVDIVDGEYNTMDEIFSLIEEKKYDLVGLQPMMASYQNTLKILKKAKEIGSITFLGGHHATQLSNEIMNNQHRILDFIIVGDGEEALSDVVKGKELKRVTNIVYYESGRIIHTAERNVPLEHGVIDYIDPQIFEQYKKNTNKKLERQQPLISFRAYSHKGCSNRTKSQYCFFCGRADKGVRFKKPKDYIRELEYLTNLENVQYIFEIGDDFLQDYDWLRQVIELRENSHINKNVHLKIFARANRITEESVKLIKKLNVDEVAIGFESGSKRVLENINKRVSPQDNLNAAKLLFSNGIDTIASFVLGLPGENDESLEETYKQACEIKKMALFYLGRKPQEIIANIIEINPGAPAFKKLKKYFPERYSGRDELDVYETQNDYFKMEFGLKSDKEIAEFRKKLVRWGNKINNLGAYTYPAGFKSSEVTDAE